MQPAAALTLTSSVLRDGQTVPASMVFSGMGCMGGDESPDLTWSSAPSGTKSFAVTMYDPDAPTTVGFVHWLLFNIPADVTHLAAGAGKKKDGGVRHARHGHTDFGFARYGGPCPPPGDPPHRYQVTVYALDTEFGDLDETATYALLRFLMRGHVLASGTITGLYGR